MVSTMIDTREKMQSVNKNGGISLGLTLMVLYIKCIYKGVCEYIFNVYIICKCIHICMYV